MRKCQYPPGCDAPAMPGHRACQPHYILVSGLMGNPGDPPPSTEEIEWARSVTERAERIVRAAYGLLGDGQGGEWDENAEYTRAIAELVGDTCGLGLDDKGEILDHIRTMGGARW